MHGGDIYNNKIEYDFSVNVNPCGPYEEIKSAVLNSAEKLSVYPEYESKTLCSKIAEVHNIDSEFVCVTNGASEAISAIIRNPYINDVIIETPSFYGYERAVHPEQQLHTYTRNSFLKLNENLIPRNSVLVIGNPSNPAGEYTDSFIIESLYKRVKSAGALLLMDESFLPLSDYHDRSFINAIRENPDYYDRLVVIRSFTKSFAIPAIRLGYFVSSNDRLTASIRDGLAEWNISLMAQECGIECLNHLSRLKNDYARIKAERKRLENVFNSFGFLVHESCTNYILFAAEKDLYKKLLDKKILIRDCSSYRGIDEITEKLLCMNISNDRYNSASNVGMFRIAVKTESENNILINAIRSALSEI